MQNEYIDFVLIYFLKTSINFSETISPLIIVNLFCFKSCLANSVLVS